MKVKHFALAGAGVVFALAAGTPVHAIKKAALKDQLTVSESVGFDVYLPAQHKTELGLLLKQQQDQTSPQFHKWLTPAQFQERFGPSAASIRAVQRELAGFGLHATLESPHRLHITGMAGQVEQALGTPLRHGVMPSGKAVVVASAPLLKPGSLSSLNAVITGLSGTIRMQSGAHTQALPQNRYSNVGPYWFDDLKQAYDWPSYTTYAGKGSTVAVLMSGGYSQADMDKYFGHEKLASPHITEVAVNGGAAYNPNDGGTIEAELDLQQSGGMAPKANLMLYSIPDLSDASVMAGLSQIIEDNKADVVNMSFGGPEVLYSAEYNEGQDYTSLLTGEDDLMAEGNALGITFVASSGDSGALSAPAVACFYINADPCGTFQASAEFPASSPHVTGVGGSNLMTTYDAAHRGNLNSAYISEEAFADPLTADIFYGTTATGGYWGSGGGDSIVFPRPAYQALVNTGNPKVRTVPDLALHMGGCPGDAVCNPGDSADVEVLGGQLIGVIGTSASAPAFAGLTALNVQRWGRRVGNENYYIYALAAIQKVTHSAVPVFHWGIPGFNGLYSSGNNGYNRVLGNGTLYGKNFLEAPLVPSAGAPQTATNP